MGRFGFGKIGKFFGKKSVSEEKNLENKEFSKEKGGYKKNIKKEGETNNVINKYKKISEHQIQSQSQIF